VDIQPLTEDNKIRRSISLFRGCFFDASSDILTEVGAETSVIKRGKACSTLSSLIDAYHRWDLFHYEEALGQIRKIEKNEANRYAEFKILSPLLAKQRLALSTVNDKGIKGYCLDLYHNAHRRFSQGHLADSIWRSYAIYEAILFNRVQSLTGCNPQDFRDTFTALQRSQKLSPETTKKINEFIRENYQGKTPHFLEGEKVKELIQRFDADFWVKTITANQERGLNSFRKKRNKIIHQGKAPDINVAREGLKMTRELIKKTPGSPAQDIDNYPFSVETIQDMAENILPSLLF
ncbi:hypothetical protein LR013_01355, partial [candidate division NPL-UPA2 bacterium]|nr:hypothetical protein [candidate division NPL-UPA2 bacterium]